MGYTLRVPWQVVLLDEVVDWYEDLTSAVPDTAAVLLMAGDKSGSWSDWYRQAIPVAEDRFRRWLSGDYTEER